MVSLHSISRQKKVLYLSVILILLWILFPGWLFDSDKTPTFDTHPTYPKSPVMSDMVSAWEKNHSRILEKVRKELCKSELSKSNTNLRDSLIPTISCPFTTERIGGKWVCGFDILANWTKPWRPCVIYSFGIDGNFSFESDILQRTPCKVLVFDLGVYNNRNSNVTKIAKSYPTRLSFTKVGLANESVFNRHWTLKPLGQLMLQNKHEWIDFLEIDMKRRELEAFDQILEEFGDWLPFGHLNVKVRLERLELKEYFEWWLKLEERGLRVYKTEINTSTKGKVPVSIESSFINVYPTLVDLQESGKQTNSINRRNKVN